MGVVLDSTILVVAERSGKSPRRAIDGLIVLLGDTDVTLSVITIAELAHGIERADLSARRDTRERCRRDS